MALSQRLGICIPQVAEIYLLHEESASSDYPARCGLAVTDVGICVKEFREKGTRAIPYDAFLFRKIHSTLNYKVSADDILLAQYRCIESIVIVPRLVDLFSTFRGLWSRSTKAAEEKIPRRLSDSMIRERGTRWNLLLELWDALLQAKRKLSTWGCDDEEDDDDNDFDWDTYKQFVITVM